MATPYGIESFKYYIIAFFLVTYAIWVLLAIRWFPSNWSRIKLIEHGLIFTLQIVFMDLVPNYLTGMLLHRVKILQIYLHRWEHRLTRKGDISSICLISTLYAWYSLFYMLLWGFVIACNSPANKGCYHWESIMWTASLLYSITGYEVYLILYIQTCQI